MNENREIKSGEIYRHFEGNLYQIITIALHTAEKEELVIYQALYGEFKIYAKPIHQFFCEVDKNRYPDAKQNYQFEEVSKEELKQNKIDSEKSGNNELEESKKIDIQTMNTKSTIISEKKINNLQAIEETNYSNLMLFLDARTSKEKIEVLGIIQKNLNDYIVKSIEISLDMPVSDADLDDRVNAIKQNLQLLARYENNRLR